MQSHRSILYRIKYGTYSCCIRLKLTLCTYINNIMDYLESQDCRSDWSLDMNFHYNEEFRVKHDSPSFVFPPNMLCSIKDTNHRIVATNNKTAQLLGFSSAEQMLKNPISDHEVQCKASQLAQNFRSEDKISFQDEKVVVLSQCYYQNDEKKLFLSEKISLRNSKNEYIGLFVSSIDITATRIINLQPLLSINGMITKLNANKLNEQFSVIIRPSYPDIKLSQRQTECLYYIINGYSSSNIGRLCQLSKRTVETYIEHIKDKLLCSSKQELIEKAISLGYLEIIPQVIFDKHLM